MNEGLPARTPGSAQVDPRLGNPATCAPPHFDSFRGGAPSGPMRQGGDSWLK
jgi:hypothetical protein